MFGNLVHLNLIRLFKSRIKNLSMVFLIVFTFLAFLIFCVTERNVVASSWGEEDLFVISKMMIVFSLFDVAVFGILNLLFSTCDYYKYRLMINVEGACRSKTRICLSEVASLVVYSLVLAIYPIIWGVLGSFFDKDTLQLFNNNMIPSLVVYIGIVYAIFSFLLPILTFAKMFRKFLPTVLSSLLLFPTFSVILAYFLLMIMNIPGLISEYIFPAFFVFSFTLAYLSHDVSNVYSVVPFIVASMVQNIIWIVIAIIASNRKYDL